jgi:hypothetical protein
MKRQVSPQFRRVLKTEVRRLMEAMGQAALPKWAAGFPADVQGYIRNLPADYLRQNDRDLSRWELSQWRDIMGASGQRQNIRALQDEILKIADRQGIKDTMRVSRNMPANITLRQLRTSVYPEYMPELRGVLAELKQG